MTISNSNTYSNAKSWDIPMYTQYGVLVYIEITESCNGECYVSEVGWDKYVDWMLFCRLACYIEMERVWVGSSSVS